MSDAEKQSTIKKVGIGSVVESAAHGWMLGKHPQEDKATILRYQLHRSYTNIQTNGIFQLNIKNKEGKEVTYVIDLKKEGTVTKGAGAKPGTSSCLAFH